MDDKGMFSFVEHTHCEALSMLFRGDLCASLTNHPGRHLEKGTVVYQQGDDGRSVYFLKQGLIKTSLLSEDGKEQILRLYKPGEVFGELCFCLKIRQEQALALEPSVVVELPFDRLITHLQQSPQALASFLSGISHHLSDAYEQIRLLSFETVLRRLVQTLLRLADEMGEPLEDWVRLQHPLTQDDLARMISARREVTSTLLNQLRSAGCIEYTPRGQFLVNPAALEEYDSAPDFVSHGQDPSQAPTIPVRPGPSVS
jgi:CRP/FNR family transcriptional regulator